MSPVEAPGQCPRTALESMRLWTAMQECHGAGQRKTAWGTPRVLGAEGCLGPALMRGSGLLSLGVFEGACVGQHGQLGPHLVQDRDIDVNHCKARFGTERYQHRPQRGYRGAGPDARRGR